MIKINSSITKSLLSLAVVFGLITSVIINLHQCSENKELYSQIDKKEHLVSKADTLLGVVFNKDSIPVSQFDVQNIPELSYGIMKKKVDSLHSVGNISTTSYSNSRGGFYTKTSFTANLDKVKPTLENDSLVAYENKNWYIGYDKRQSLFDAKYRGEVESIAGYQPKQFLPGINLKNNDFTNHKWFNDKNVNITSSETIYTPPKPIQENKIKVYTNSEYRQGFNIENQNININSPAAVYQGIGISHKNKRHEFGVEGNYKIIGSDALPKQEIKLKYNFYIFK